jgi:hypothetical protein
VALSISRVVYRGYNNANSNGGVSNANANNDASNSNSNVGSRLEIKLFGVPHRGRVPIAEPRITSLSNSGAIRKTEKSRVG